MKRKMLAVTARGHRNLMKGFVGAMPGMATEAIEPEPANRDVTHKNFHTDASPHERRGKPHEGEVAGSPIL
jgi:hypothetical protein